MGTKPNPKAWKARSSLESAHSEAPARPHPWLKAYPKSVTWDVKIEPKLLGDQLDQAVAAYGARPCTYFMGKRLSYAEIGALSDRAAKGLREEGVGEGVKVGLFMPNTPAFVIFYYGVLKAGGTVVNFNPLYSLEEIETQIRDSGVKIMVTLDLALTYDKIEALLKRRALERAVVVSFTSLLPALKSVGFKLTQRAKLAAVGRAGERAELVRAEDLLANDGQFKRPAITPDAIAVLQYTGGTTGTPKGAMLSHANLSVNIGQLETWQNRIVSAGDRIVGVLPLFHVFAMTTVMNFWHQPRARDHPAAEIRVDPDLEVDRQVAADHDAWRADAIQRHAQVSAYRQFRLDFAQILHGRRRAPADRSEARLRAILRRHSGRGLRLERDIARRSVQSAGRAARRIDRSAAAGHRISIRSLDDPTVEVKAGETGEICIAGPQVMTGYRNKPQDTEDCFAGRFFRTGESATWMRTGTSSSSTVSRT